MYIRFFHFIGKICDDIFHIITFYNVYNVNLILSHKYIPTYQKRKCLSMQTTHVKQFERINRYKASG